MLLIVDDLSRTTSAHTITDNFCTSNICASPGIANHDLSIHGANNEFVQIADDVL